MTKKLVLLVAFLMLCASFQGCGSKSSNLPPPTVAPVFSSIKIRVTDVSNDTRELYDVDVIGMTWTALEDSLKKRGMLWKPEADELPYTMQARVLRYEEGSAWWRWIFPPWGRTTLTVKADLKEGGRVIASAEGKQTFTFGHGTFTSEAWRKVFGDVAEDLVGQLTRSL